MTVSSLSNIGVQTTNKNASSSNSASSLAQNFDTFLTLLTTQLKNQDPTSPMDSDKFTDQLSQFAQVEQGIQTNKNLENLLGMQEQQRQLSALSYVGAQVEAVGDTNWLRDGQDMDFKYSIPEEVPNAQLQIVDQSGKTIYSEDIKNEGGVQHFVWDGKDSGGTRQAEGAYTLVIKPKTESGDDYKTKDGKAPSISIGITGTVDSVDIGDSDIYLRVGDVSVPFASLTNVKLGANSSDSGSGSDTGSGSGSDSGSGSQTSDNTTTSTAA